MSVGRNEPCPCGSGKKFKRCHGAEAMTVSPGAARAKSFKTVDVELGSHLMRFANKRFGPRWIDEALANYAGGEDVEVPQHELSLAIPWILHCWRAQDDAPTIAELWADERPERVTSEQQTVLRAYQDTWLSIWEVTRVERSVGAALVDQLTRKECFAYDAAASSTIDVRDSVLALVIDCDGVSFFGGIHPQPLAPVHAGPTTVAARRFCRVRTRAVAPAKLRNSDLQLGLIDLWNDAVDAVLMAPPPTITNTDGDVVSPTTDDFELIAPRADVVAQLASMPGAGEPETDGRDDIVVFTKAGNAVHRQWDNTVIGHAIVNSRSLRVETNSVRRADSLRAAIQKHLEGLVRYRLRQQTSERGLLEGAVNATGRSSRTNSARQQGQPPEIAAALRSFREQHMRAWIDDNIPALGGLTPRAAAHTSGARQALETLLKSIERDESRLPLDQQIDLSWLRPELRMD